MRAAGWGSGAFALLAALAVWGAAIVGTSIGDFGPPPRAAELSLAAAGFAALTLQVTGIFSAVYLFVIALLIARVLLGSFGLRNRSYPWTQHLKEGERESR